MYGRFWKLLFKKYFGYKLIWCLGLSKLEIQYLYTKYKNISISTLIQYLILLQLEKYETLSLAQLAINIGCKISTIITDIQGLIFNPSYNPKGIAEKGIILGTFNVQNKDFKENDIVKINKTNKKFNTMSFGVKKLWMKLKN